MRDLTLLFHGCIFLALFSATAAMAENEAPRTLETCEKAGGVWSRLGLLGTEGCNMKTKDAGKSCRSKADCESECITQSKGLPGTEAAGTCYGWLITLGTCLTRVEDGKVTGTLCVD